MRFYVYRIFDLFNRTIYIGKGCGNRLKNQIRRFRAEGEIIKRFDKEFEALKYEAKLILELKPPLNIRLGGGRIQRNQPATYSFMDMLFKLMSFKDDKRDLFARVFPYCSLPTQAHKDLWIAVMCSPRWQYA